MTITVHVTVCEQFVKNIEPIGDFILITGKYNLDELLATCARTAITLSFMAGQNSILLPVGAEYE